MSNLILYQVLAGGYFTLERGELSYVGILSRRKIKMAVVIPLDDPANYKLVLIRIKRLYRDGYILILPHALRRMAERHFETTDLQHVILTGRIVDHSRPQNYWRYVVRGKPPDGKEVDCVLEINDRLIVISIYFSARRRK